MYIVSTYTRIKQRFYIPDRFYRCPKCKEGGLEPFDHCKRILRYEDGTHEWCEIPRHRCSKCRFTSRMLPDVFTPYKQYGSVVISEVVAGILKAQDAREEEFPSGQTIKMWWALFKAIFCSIEEYQLDDRVDPDEWFTTMLKNIYNDGGA